MKAPATISAQFATALRQFPPDRPVWLLGHHAVDGLASLALLARLLQAAGRPVRVRVLGRGESPWSAPMREELAGEAAAGLIIVDLGVRPYSPKPGTPTVVVHHHGAGAAPADATVLTGAGMQPEPPSALLAYWCAAALVDPAPWLWIAAIGMIGDRAEPEGFPEMALAQRYGADTLREAAALVGAPHRTADGDISPALSLLMTATGPRDITRGASPEATALQTARAEVDRELEAARSAVPQRRGGMALVAFESPAQIHPLLAEQWSSRLRQEVVLAANTGFRPGWVHFAVRSAEPRGLAAFLAQHGPPGANDAGSARSSNGALRAADWNSFVAGLGFGPEAQVAV